MPFGFVILFVKFPSGRFERLTFKYYPRKEPREDTAHSSPYIYVYIKLALFFIYFVYLQSAIRIQYFTVTFRAENYLHD